jgi:hypothetical protein
MGTTLMNKYGYITDSTYDVADTAITWDFVRYNEDKTTTDFVGIESTISIESDKVVMFETPKAFTAWKYEFEPEEDI